MAEKSLGLLLKNFVLSRITDGADPPGHCARALVALESLGRLEQEVVAGIINKYGCL